MRLHSRRLIGLSASLVLLAGAATYVIHGDPGDPPPISAAATPIPSPTATPSKFYIVGEPVDGRREYLFSIAAKTLGDGNRYREIFELNRGRRQPGGGRLVDPAVVEPGWVLLLPADAAGPFVKLGRLVPSPTPARASRADGGLGQPLEVALRAVCLALVVALLLWAVGRLRRGTRLATPRLVRTAAPTVDDSMRRIRRRAGPPDGGQSTPDPSRPPPRPPVLRAAVVSGADTVDVRLVGVRGGSAASTAGWVYADARPAGAATPVAIGTNGQGTLYADLALAPDVITITGSEPARRRLGLALARQLTESGAQVTVVGNPIGATHGAGFQLVETFDQATRGPAGARARFVFFGDNSGDSAVIHRAIAASVPRLVPVLLGDVRRARWSLDVREGRSRRALPAPTSGGVTEQ